MSDPDSNATTTITEALAQFALMQIKVQYGAYLADDATTAPVLYGPGHEGPYWVISWEGGPYEWALGAFQDGVDEEVYAETRAVLIAAGRGEAEAADEARRIATVKGVGCPAGVFAEPVNSFTLALHRAE